MKQNMMRLYQLICLGGLGIALPVAVFATTPEGTSSANAAETESSAERTAQQHLQDMYAIIHSAEFTTINRDDGIATTVTSSDSALVDAIHDELVTHQDALANYFTDISVAAESTENGATFTFTTKNAEQLSYLQTNGNFVLSGFIMTQMMQTAHRGGINMMTSMMSQGKMNSSMMSGGMMGRTYDTNTASGMMNMMGTAIMSPTAVNSLADYMNSSTYASAMMPGVVSVASTNVMMLAAWVIVVLVMAGFVIWVINQQRKTK